MKTFFETIYSEYLAEAEKDFIPKETVAFLIGSFKPPHKGHFKMLQEYLKHADRAIIIVSTTKTKNSQREFSNGKVMTADEAKRIWEIFLEDYGLENRVKVETAEHTKTGQSNVIAKLADEIDDLHDAKVILGISTKDLENAKRRFKFIIDTFSDKPDIIIEDPERTAIESEKIEKNGKPIAATKIRENPGNKLLLRRFMPPKISDEHFEEIFKIINPGKN